MIYILQSKSGKPRELPIGEKLSSTFKALGPKKGGRVFDVPEITLRAHFQKARNCSRPSLRRRPQSSGRPSESLDSGLRIVTGPYGSEMPLPKSFGKRPGVMQVVTKALAIKVVKNVYNLREKPR